MTDLPVPPRKPTTANERGGAQSAAVYQAVFDSVDEGFCLLEVLFDAAGRPRDYRVLDTNPAFERQSGLTDAVGKTARELAPDLEDHWVETYGTVVTTGEAVRFEAQS